MNISSIGSDGLGGISSHSDLPEVDKDQKVGRFKQLKKSKKSKSTLKTAEVSSVVQSDEKDSSKLLAKRSISGKSITKNTHFNLPSLSSLIKENEGKVIKKKTSVPAGPHSPPPLNTRPQKGILKETDPAKIKIKDVRVDSNNPTENEINRSSKEVEKKRNQLEMLYTEREHVQDEWIRQSQTRKVKKDKIRFSPDTKEGKDLPPPKYEGMKVGGIEESKALRQNLEWKLAMEEAKDEFLREFENP